MKIILANPPWRVNGKKGVRAGSRWPHIKIPEEEDYMPFPFFLAQAAALLKKKGFEVLLVDAIAEEITENEFLKRVRKFQPDLVVNEVSTPSLEKDLRIASKIKKISKSAKIVLCGADMNIRNLDFVEKYGFIDFVLIGEYEFTLLGLVRCLENEDDLSKVKGIIYKKQNKAIKTEKRPLQDVNKIPWPLREQLPMHKYHDCPGGIPSPSVQMIASRGCPYGCTFCAWPQMMYHGRNYRARDPKDVVDEMEYLVKKKGFRSVYFDDDTFNIGRERMLKICKEIKKRKINVPWAIMARADLMDEKLLDEMKSAGLYAIKYGVESAVQRIVDNANKGLNLKKAEAMIKYTNKIGIKTHLTFMFGLPGETHKTIQKTIDFAIRMNPESVQFSIATPFPGTRYYKELDKKGMIVSKEWPDYDGNLKCVVKTEKLSSEDLQNAVKEAYKRWSEHRENRFKNESLFSQFKKCFAEHGLNYTAKRIIMKILKISEEKEKRQKIIPKDNLVLKDFYENRLDLVGVSDGKYAFTFPNLVQIDLTNKCNNSCIGCWCNSPLLKEKKISKKESEATLPYKKVIEIINELKHYGTKESYLGGGGEPFMHPNIIDIIRHIKSKGLVCHINTNFTLVNENIAKKLVDWKIDHITVSLWAGDAETYVKTHPNQNEEVFHHMEKILKIIRKLKKQKNQEKPLIKIYNVISSLNYDNIEKMAEFAYKNSDSVEFSIIDIVEGKTESLLLNEKQRKGLLKKCKKLKEKYENKKDFVIFRFDQFIKRISTPLSVKGVYDKESVDSVPCYVGWTFSRILANGNVIPCLKAHKMSMGNILKANFKDIFFSERYSRFRFMAKNFKKDDRFFDCINCYKSCDDLGRNKEMHEKINSLDLNKKRILDYVREIIITPGMIEFLKKKGVKTEGYEQEQKIITKNILNWNVEEIKERVYELNRSIDEKIMSISIKTHKNNLDYEKLRKKIKYYFKRELYNKDILLVIMPPWDTKMPPLNLAYLVTYLKNKGIKVDIYDFNIIFYNAVKENDKDYWCMENQLEKQKEAYINKIIKNNQDIINKFISQIIKSKINIIGFSINQSNFLFSLKVAERIKKENNNIKIIFGGSAIFYKKFRDKTPSEVCDYFIIGEGERAIYNLVKSLKKKKEIENISEIGTNKKENKNNFVQNKSIMNINEIPYPTFEEFDLELYSEKQLPILISRGCIGKCSYCVDWIMSGVYRFKNAERVVEELKYLKQKYNIDRFQLNDLLCNGNLKQLEDICDLIIKNNLKIDLFGYATIRKDMSIDLLKKMKEAGFISVHYGFESGSDEVLKLMNKNYTSKDAEQLIKKTKEAGLEVAINIIVGFPGESEKNFKETLNFIKRNKEYIDYIANVSICFIMRGSMIYNHPERFNFKLTDNVENWYDKYNNKRIRIKKAERITKLINDLNIKLGIKNFYN